MDTLGWAETLLGWPVVAASAAAIVFAFIGIHARSAVLGYLGKISYGLYVYHLLCIWIAETVLRNGSGLLHQATVLILALGLTTLCAAVSYALIEKPFLKLKRKYTYVSSRPT